MSTKSKLPAKHPIQPLVADKDKVLRFKANAIVQYLLDNGGIDMNRLACLKFSDEDRQQFAQLIGYSLTGYGELSRYVDDEAYEAAAAMADSALDTNTARIRSLEKKLAEIRSAFRPACARLFGIHKDDLK